MIKRKILLLNVLYAVCIASIILSSATLLMKDVNSYSLVEYEGRSCKCKYSSTYQSNIVCEDKKGKITFIPIKKVKTIKTIVE